MGIKGVITGDVIGSSQIKIEHLSGTQAGMMYMSLRQGKTKKNVADITGTSVQNVRNVLSNAKELLICKYIERNIELIEWKSDKPKNDYNMD